MMLVKIRLAVLAAATLLAPLSAHAQTLTSLSRATFQTAISSGTTLGVQNFDGLTTGSTLTNDGTVTYAASVGTPLVTSSYLTSTNPNGLGRTGVGFFLTSDTATFSFASAISAFAIDVNTFSTANGSYRAVLNNGEDAFSIFETFPGTGTGQFIGFTSLNSFTSVTISSLAGQPYTLDTLIYGERSAVQAAVPEPASWAMLIIGFGLIGGVLRSRRTQRPLARC